MCSLVVKRFLLQDLKAFITQRKGKRWSVQTQRDVLGEVHPLRITVAIWHPLFFPMKWKESQELQGTFHHFTVSSLPGLPSSRTTFGPACSKNTVELTICGGGGCGRDGCWQRWLYAGAPAFPSLSPRSWCWCQCWWRACESAGCGLAADPWVESEVGEEQLGLKRRSELKFGSVQSEVLGRRLERELELESEQCCWCYYRSGSGGWRSGGAPDDAGGGGGWSREAVPEPGAGCCGDGDSLWKWKPMWSEPAAVVAEEEGEEAREEAQVGEERRAAGPNGGPCSLGWAGPAGPPTPQFGAAAFLKVSAGFQWCCWVQEDTPRPG